MINRAEAEILQGKIIADQADSIWGWASPAGQKRVERRAALLCKYGQLKKNISVLELGCGTGIFTEKIAKTGVNLTAIDISPNLLNIAQQRVLLENVKFEISNAENLDFKEDSFDVVLGSSILHHLNIDAVIPEIRRVLRTNGRLIFAEPNMLNPQIFLDRHIPFLRKLMHTTPHETAFYRCFISKKLKKYEFGEVQAFPYDFLHPLVPAFLIKIVEPIGLLMEKIPIVQEIAGSLIICGVKK